MSVCQSGPTEDDSASEEVGASVRDIYKEKPASKVVRVLTVLAYLLSVSLAAILLSVYYIWVWKSPDLPPSLNHTGSPAQSAQRGHRHEYGDTDHVTQAYLDNRGSDSTVSGDTVHTPPENITSWNTNVSDTTTEITQDTTIFPDTTSQEQNLTSDDIGVNNTDSIT